MARGDHIKVRRLGGIYTHHGIDLGDGNVVHFDGEPLRLAEACVRVSTMEDFLRGGTKKTVEHPATARDADEVCEAALARLGETGYDLFRNNCEHFAHECKIGNGHSRQVRRFKRIALATAGTAAALALSVVVRNTVTRKRNTNTA